MELETAFAQGIPVVPVLVGDARMPLRAELPVGLEQLALLQAAEIRSGRDMAQNTDRLVQAIGRFIADANPNASILKEPIRTRAVVQPPLPRLASGKKGKAYWHRVYISYRREGGAETARLMRYELKARGWRVFLDVEDLKAGHFDQKLLSEVAAADNFPLILSKGALKNCTDKDDWLRKEILKAIETERNIVPLLKEHASAPGKEDLPADIKPVGKFNSVDYSHVYYDATIDRLLSFLRQASGSTRSLSAKG